MVVLHLTIPVTLERDTKLCRNILNQAGLYQSNAQFNFFVLQKIKKGSGYFAIDGNLPSETFLP